MITKTAALAAQDDAFTEELKHIFDVMRSNAIEDRALAIEKFETAFRELLLDHHDACAVIDSCMTE